MGNTLKMTALAAVLAGAASGAAAATVNFEFGGANAMESSLLFGAAPGLTLTVTSARYDADGTPGFTTAGTTEVTQQMTHGLGVCSSFNSNGGCAGDNQQLDGNDFAEMLIFTFSEAVSLLSIDFRQEGNDNFDLLSGSSVATLVRDVQAAVLVNNGPIYVPPNTLGRATVFAIANPNQNDQYRIGALSVQTTDPTPSVPLPAGGFLLMSGLAAAGLLRRRKRA